MAEYSASQITIANGFKAVVIESGESPENVRQGDFLFVTGSDPVAINRTYINDNGQHVIELTKNWGQGNKNNQPAIVLPSTAEYKTVADALKNANLLVNDNFVAMQDWQTKTGTVTFVNIDGTTTTVKTLKQIESEAQAQLDAYHPHPWAMRKVEFEARRAANREQFAASGFVHFGRHNHNDSTLIAVGEGLFTRHLKTTKDSIFLGCSDEIETAKGDSKEAFPLINIAGVTSRIYGSTTQATSYGVQVKFPPAEEGLRTYDSSTGISVTHESFDIAFASETETNKVVLNRVDLWGFEAFLREVSDADPFVYANGLIQSLVTEINGVPTVKDTIRPTTYFSWYVGDNDTIGKGVNWQTATEPQRIAIASDPENNIYFDDATGKFYQWCIRGRSFSGDGDGDWESVDSESPSPLVRRKKLGVIRPQGILDENNLPQTTAWFKGFGGRNLASQGHGDGVYSKGHLTANIEATNSGFSGECYFLVCGTVNRLNKGAYHPNFNPQGAAGFEGTDTGCDYWYFNSVPLISSTFDCFDTKAVTYEPSGSVDRPDLPRRIDKRYYDIIYSSGQGGICRDMRYSAWGLKPEDFEVADLKIKSGDYRGIENPTRMRIFKTEQNTVNETNGVQVSDTKDIEALSLGSLVYLYRISTGEVIDLGPITEINVVSKFFRGSMSYFRKAEEYAVIVAIPLTPKLSFGGEYRHIDVVGNPLDILACDDLKGGWLGGWIPVIPDGVRAWSQFRTTRPTSKVNIPRVYSDDKGVSWAAAEFSFSNITNSPDVSAPPPLGRIDLLEYPTKASQTEESENYEVYQGEKGLGSVYASSRYTDWNGSDLGYGLAGLILRSNSTISYDTMEKEYSVIVNDGKIHPSLISHASLRLSNPSEATAPAFKALNYNVVDNQQGFINYAYTELVYDDTAGDWGDDGKIHIADNQATRLDDNGNSVVYGTARIVEPLGWIKNDK